MKGTLPTERLGMAGDRCDEEAIVSRASRPLAGCGDGAIAARADPSGETVRTAGRDRPGHGRTVATLCDESGARA